MHRVEGGAQVARHDVPFLFKAFETGQMRPPRPGSKAALQPRASTIHEYLDWTFMAVEGADEDDLVGACSCTSPASALCMGPIWALQQNSPARCMCTEDRDPAWQLAALIQCMPCHTPLESVSLLKRT